MGNWRLNFSKRLKEFRTKAKLTQYELADNSGVRRDLISQYERGTRCPGIDILLLLSSALGISLLELIGE